MVTLPRWLAAKGKKDCESSDRNRKRRHSHVLPNWIFAVNDAVKSRQSAIHVNRLQPELEVWGVRQVVKPNRAVNLFKLYSDWTSALLEQLVGVAENNFRDQIFKVFRFFRDLVNEIIWNTRSLKTNLSDN